MPKYARRSCAALALALFAVALPLAPAHAAGQTLEESGLKKLGKYLTCAGSLALAPTIPAAVMGFLGCVNQFVEEMSVE